MKQVKTIFAGFIAVGFLTASIAFAEDLMPAKDHDHNHAEEPAKQKAKDSGMMGSMNMGDMQGMMKNCMEMHKDGKMCDHQMMEKCRENMGKGECEKMMKQAKTNDKTKKTK